MVLWQRHGLVADSINMYDLNNDLDGYCISYHWRYVYRICKSFCRQNNAVEMMSYCRRPFQDNDSSTNVNITFAQLKEKNITSEMLLSWSASINVAEQYQIFLNSDAISSSDNEVIFQNCTAPWFGPSCRFIIDHPFIGSFYYLVDGVFLSKWAISGDSKVTCYIHLTCQTLLSCLDWREICDGKQACIGGEDERDCWQLEMNECNDDEYRCWNGQCISWEYYRDGVEQTECLDRTDELHVPNVICYQNPNFKCEEHACSPGIEEFPCGDGQCIDEMSTCQNGRHSFLPNNICTNATLCFLGLYNHVDYEWCMLFCVENDCVTDNCFTAYEFQHLPFYYGHVRYIVSNTNIDSSGISLPDYICYNARLCPHLPPPMTPFDNLTCRHFDDLGLQYANSYTDLLKLAGVIKNLFRGCLVLEYYTAHCNSSTRYQCVNVTKCISKHRLMDGMKDCPFGDDEIYNQSCSLADIRQRFKCRDEDHEECFALLAQQNGKQECKYGEDEYEEYDLLVRTHIFFSTICDGVTHLLPSFIDGRNENDETDCQLWECNNTYSRCDGVWLCKNGADEMDCLPSNCSTNHHRCVFLNDTSTVSCLPIERAGDDIDDCVGGIDERTKNRLTPTSVYDDIIQYGFRCQNHTKLIWTSSMCNNRTDCPLNEDETFCKNFVTYPNSICWISEDFQTDVETFLCNLRFPILRKLIIPFKLHNTLSYPSELEVDNTSIVPSLRSKSLVVPKDLRDEFSSDLGWACNRGVPFQSRMNGNNTLTLSCFCPPSYYGDRCQYQNQRVSLTLQIQLTSDWRTIFIFLITLIDTETNIESHEHLEYIPQRDCPIKYNIYLLYATRPKITSKNYSVRIDAFCGMTLKYRSSWMFPLQFLFLPVHRLAVVLRVPFLTTILSQQKCSPSCIHGQCSMYVNNPNFTFCHCRSGWSGVRCDIKVKCNCASDAICISDSICLCPPGRFGPRCYLSHAKISHLEACSNGGQRVPIDARYVSTHEISSICICPEGYTGYLCKRRQKQIQIDISFHHKLTIPSSLLIHLIGVPEYDQVLPSRISMAKKLQFDQTSLTIYTTTSFNIALVQMLGHYYLIILSEESITRTSISTEVIPAHRCQSLAELFNSTFANQQLLKRIKFYHLPCKQHEELLCFYDDVHMCLCTFDRSANCLEFDHNMMYECEKLKYCGDEGECFQDDLTCPTSSFCACHRCYFGSRCQFSTKGSTLSLDIILGYHIRSTDTLSQQATIVKTAIALTSIILVIGIINGFLSFQTFRSKESRNVGCGLYLLTTSILSIVTVMILTFKFTLLIVSQVGSIDNRLFLRIQCTSMDFMLRFLMSTNDWLNAFVAIERVVSVTQGVKFNRAKSKQIARWMIVIVVLCVGCSYIYDPVHRRVVDDEEEQKTWCITQYSPSVQVLDWIMNIVHFSCPFIINGISAFIIIITIARTRSNAQKTRPFKEHLREQFYQHKHLLISPLILVAFGLPRLVISFLSGCMGTARESWLYLMGYYISFMPIIMTVIVFTLPSELYKKELYETIKRICRR